METVGQEPENPYRPPAASAPPPVPTAPGDCFREGAFLIVRERSEVPPFCVKNGEDVPADGWRKKKAIAWSPPWVWVGLLGGVLPLLILILVAQKKANITYSLGAAARRRMGTLRGIGFALLAGFVFLLVAAVNSSSSDAVGMLVTLGFLLLLGSLICFMLVAPIRPVKHRNGWFKVKGVSPALLDRLPAVDFRGL
jgi:hypothetical protein